MADRHRSIKIIGYWLLGFGMISPVFMLLFPEHIVGHFYWSILYRVSIPAIAMSGLIALLTLDKLTFFIGLIIFLTVILIGILNELFILAFQLPPAQLGNYTIVMTNMAQVAVASGIWYVFLGVLIITWNRIVRKEKSIL